MPSAWPLKTGSAIEFIRKSSLRKNGKIRATVGEGGSHPGLVAILSAMEPCSSYKPWPGQDVPVSVEHTKRRGSIA
jgi:hypothetical protein